MIFNIQAPIAQQRAGKCEVVAIHDSGLDCLYPLSVWVTSEREINARHYTREGRYVASAAQDDYDLHTVPEVMPISENFINEYPNESCMHKTSFDAAGNRGRYCLSTIRVVYDPNTKTVVSSVIWSKP